MTATLGIDLGGTNARTAVVSREGKILSSAKTALQDRTPAAVVDAIALATSSALAAIPGATILGCGVGVAGQLEVGSGRVVVAPNLGWRDIPLGELLAARLGRPVRLMNDLTAAAWGELRAGAARGERELLVVFVGSGVGSAIIANGQLVHGATGVAAELGHIKVEPGGRPCGCGELGCLEAYAGGHNLIAQMQEALEAGAQSAMRELVGGDLSLLTPVVLERAALSGDPLAKGIYDRAAGHLALAIANQVTVLNPGRLLLGGGVLNHCPGLKARIAEGVARYSSVVSRAAVTLTPAALGDDSGIIGAALLAAEGR